MIDTDAARTVVDALKDWGGYAIAGLFAIDKWRGAHAKTLLEVRADIDDAKAIDRRTGELDAALARVIKTELLLEAERLKSARVEAELLKSRAAYDAQQDIIDEVRAEANRWRRLARKAPAAAIAAEFARTDIAVDEIRKPRKEEP